MTAQAPAEPDQRPQRVVQRLYVAPLSKDQEPQLKFGGDCGPCVRVLGFAGKAEDLSEASELARKVAQRWNAAEERNRDCPANVLRDHLDSYLRGDLSLAEFLSRLAHHAMMWGRE